MIWGTAQDILYIETFIMRLKFCIFLKGSLIIDWLTSSALTNRSTDRSLTNQSTKNGYLQDLTKEQRISFLVKRVGAAAIWEGCHYWKGPCSLYKATNKRSISSEMVPMFLNFSCIPCSSLSCILTHLEWPVSISWSKKEPNVFPYVGAYDPNICNHPPQNMIWIFNTYQALSIFGILW